MKIDDKRHTAVIKIFDNFRPISKAKCEKRYRVHSLQDKFTREWLKTLSSFPCRANKFYTRGKSTKCKMTAGRFSQFLRILSRGSYKTTNANLQDQRHRSRHSTPHQGYTFCGAIPSRDAQLGLYFASPRVTLAQEFTSRSSAVFAACPINTTQHSKQRRACASRTQRLRVSSPMQIAINIDRTWFPTQCSVIRGSKCHNEMN